MAFVLFYLESNQYEERVAAAQALLEICQNSKMEDLPEAQRVIDALHNLVNGKQFNNKEVVVEAYSTVLVFLNEAGNERAIEALLKQI